MRFSVLAFLFLVLSSPGCKPDGDGQRSDEAVKTPDDRDGVVTDGGLALKPGTGTSATITKTPTYISYFSGNTTNVSPVTHASLLLVGGGLDRDDAMQWFVDRAGKGDVVVLRESGSDGYNDWLLAKGANSVDSIVISSATAANDPVVLAKVRRAEALFFAGGDQSFYVKYWKDTALETEINAAAERGVPVGGTSAGLAILGEFLYPAFGRSVTSATALANPYSRDVMVDRNFLAMPGLAGVITDTHFVARDRMGRLLTFMARIVKDGWAPSVRGIGVDETVAIGIDENKIGRIFADSGKAYMLATSVAPTTCTAGTPLTLQGIAVQRIGAGATFDFKTWTATGGLAYSLSVQAGIVSSSNGSVY